MIDADALARKLDRRDGFKVVAFREVGLPIFRLKSLVTLQETSSIGSIEEFVLRCIGQTVDTFSDMEAFLGLPRKIVAGQIVQLVCDGSIYEASSSPPRYALTRSGRGRIDDASSIKIVKEQIPIYVDGITRHAIAVETGQLWSSDQLEPLGISLVSPMPRRAPRSSDIDLAEVNRVFALLSSDGRAAKRAIRFDAILGRVSIVFRRAIALAFKSDDGRRMSIGFAIEGRESEEHEIEYARNPDALQSMLFGNLFDPDKRRREIQIVARELRVDVPQVFAGSERGSGGRSVLVLQKNRDGHTRHHPDAKVRTLSVYEHAPLLRQSFEEAKQRVLIISPWIRRNVVNSEFITRLVQCLERGVKVTIAYGIGRRDSRERREDSDARDALVGLTKTFANLRLVRKGDTHAKILLVDSSFFVTTSFNWLSFNGDPKQPMREEEGTLVQDAALVDGYYEKLMGRIDPANVA